MCLCDPEFKAASERGLLPQAIDHAARSCPRGDCVSSEFADWISQFSLRFPFKRDLRGDKRRKLLVARWYLVSGEEIPDAVERFWRPDGEIGVAPFCTVQLGQAQGFIHALRASDEASGSADQGKVLIDGDAAFLEAIAWARQKIALWLGASPAAARVRLASVRLDHPHAPFTGKSVALAALVAFASLALRLPVQPDLVFTGVPGSSDLQPPESATLPTKLRATALRGSKARLIAPPGSRVGLAAPEARSVLLECSWQGALCEALGQPDFSVLEAEARHHGSRPVEAALRPAEEFLRDQVYACLFAAGTSGLSLYEVELCFDELRKTEPRLNEFSSSIRHELFQLQRLEVTVEQQERWTLHNPATLPLPLLLERSRQALATIHERQRNLLDALLQRLALHQPEQAARLLDDWLGDSDPEGSRAALATGMGQLLAATRRNADLTRELENALSRTLRLPRHLLQVVLRCSALPAPFSSLAAVWAGCLQPPDRLFWLQAVTEAALHTLLLQGAPALLASASSPVASMLAEHARRPALGTLFRLTAQSTAVAPPGAEQNARAWNRLLHHTGAWRELDQTTPAALDAACDRLALDTLELLARLALDGDALVAQQMPHGTTGEHDPELQILPDGTWLFRRGVLDGQVRYWGWDRPTDARRTPGQVSTPVVLVDPTAQASSLCPFHEQNLPLDRLPTPIAQALLALRRETSPLLRLALIDESLHWLLRLAIPEASAAHNLAKNAGWAQARHKRSLLEAIQRDESATAALGAYLRAKPGGALAFRMVGVLERLEHAPGPLSSWGDWIDLASRLLAALMLASPWIEGAELFGLPDGAPKPTLFKGLRCRLAPPPSLVPEPCSPGSIWVVHQGQVAASAGWFRLGGTPKEPQVLLALG